MNFLRKIGRAFDTVMDNTLVTAVILSIMLISIIIALLRGH
jgi:hypothetical protein